MTPSVSRGLLFGFLEEEDEEDEVGCIYPFCLVCTPGWDVVDYDEPPGAVLVHHL